MDEKVLMLRRSKYTLADLGLVNISFAGKRWHREDFAVPNDRGQRTE
jgi:hypothetical protein